MGAPYTTPTPVYSRITLPSKVCAWCESVLSSERSGRASEQNFGMCTDCQQKQLARPRILVSPQPLRP